MKQTAVVAIMFGLALTACATPGQEAYRQARNARAVECHKPFPQYTHQEADRFGTQWIQRKDGRPFDEQDTANLNTLRACLKYEEHLKAAP